MNKKPIAVCAIGSIIAVLFLWEQVQATKLGYDVGEVRLLLRTVRDKTDHLQLELDRRQSPQRLAERARRRLGMTPAEPESIVFLGNDVSRASVPSPGLRTASAVTSSPIGSGRTFPGHDMTTVLASVGGTR